ncbi:hypothetical protein [Actinocrispum wychmicini]|uniref:Uncharacterized protein n=1 Tax=Actinocrispum wychmicini TaxID=1213861 RepID=A0A4R2JF04_9PSEU|nr:hypothetical protein [Actinocrispum wychmicini]TCO56802.1 hypothetical protein EV192_106277 [Actinocrispum wychmicini]
MSTWYLGPDGDLRALPVPERDPSMDVVRYGGIHQALSGARTMDVTGHRTEYGFAYRLLEAEEYAWLEALASSHIPGPLRLLTPFKRNRLTAQAASLIPASGVSVGASLPGLWNWEPDWPAAAPGSRSLRWTSYPAGAVLRLDADRRCPVLPDESITASLYARTDTGTVAVEVTTTAYDRTGTVLGDNSHDDTVPTDWYRMAFSWTPPPGTATVDVTLTIPAGPVPIRLAAAQLEPGDAATDWQHGGGAPLVLVDQLTTTSPRFPLVDCTLTLLEA